MNFSFKCEIQQIKLYPHKIDAIPQNVLSMYSDKV